ASLVFGITKGYPQALQQGRYRSRGATGALVQKAGDKELQGQPSLLAAFSTINPQERVGGLARGGGGAYPNGSGKDLALSWQRADKPSSAGWWAVSTQHGLAACATVARSLP